MKELGDNKSIPELDWSLRYATNMDITHRLCTGLISLIKYCAIQKSLKAIANPYQKKLTCIISMFSNIYIQGIYRNR